MDPIIEAISKLMPLGAWFEKMGWGKELGEAVAVVIVTLLLGALIFWVTRLWKHYENLKAARNLMPQFDEASIRQARRYYIPTQYQNASPTRQEEPGFTHQYIARAELIPFFINNAFNTKVESERFYLILADSGMGKTTFMINLYMTYHSFFNHKKRRKMRLFRFSHPDTLSDINAIHGNEARNTILLLDALDEDPNIVSKNLAMTDTEAFQNRLDEIINATRSFCEVIITCRTQYFPGQENDPYELTIKRPDEKGFYTLNKIYISPFSDKDVKRYLNKKFGLFGWINHKKKRALKVVQMSNLILVRPMILSYIDYLIEEKESFQSIYEIYETLVNRWLIREGEKRKKNADRVDYINNLRKVSEKCALEIYQNWPIRTYLKKEEAVKIAHNNNIDLRAEEITGQSLLTCDGDGNWKFAHKSIWEFFLAREAIENFTFFKSFNFFGMDMAFHFFEERNKLMILGIPAGRLKRDPKLYSFFWTLYANPFEASIPISSKNINKEVGVFILKTLTNPTILKGALISFFYTILKMEKREQTNLESGAKEIAKIIYKAHKITLTADDANQLANALNDKYGFEQYSPEVGDSPDFSGFRILSTQEHEYALHFSDRPLLNVGLFLPN